MTHTFYDAVYSTVDVIVAVQLGFPRGTVSIIKIGLKVIKKSKPTLS